MDTDEVIPAMFIFKAKITNKGYLDKLKARLVARGDLQTKHIDDDVWALCIFARTFKTFLCFAVKHNRAVHQLDFVGAFCQGFMKQRMFLQLPIEYKKFFPQYKQYFEKPLLLAKSIYGINVAHKVFADDLHDWLVNKEDQQSKLCKQLMIFVRSDIDPGLYVWRGEKEDEFCFLICYVDDCCYFGSNDLIEKR